MDTLITIINGISRKIEEIRDDIKIIYLEILMLGIVEIILIVLLLAKN